MKTNFKGILEFDSLLPDADNMISLSSPKMKVKKCAFCQNFFTSLVSFRSLSCVTLALDVPSLAEAEFLD